jgi:hypothetical protein
MSAKCQKRTLKGKATAVENFPPPCDIDDYFTVVKSAGFHEPSKADLSGP